jgi:hypothetical protein
MGQRIKLPRLNEEDAMARILSWLQSPKKGLDSVSFPSYGHELYIPNVIYKCLNDVIAEDRRQNPEGMRTYEMDPDQVGSSVFYDAAALLCQRGILRTDPPNRNANGVDIGKGFSLTSYGRQWLEQRSTYEHLPFEHDRFSQLLSLHSSRFGDGYHARCQEAVNCYRAQTYLACCVMCGAAAESILLSLAIGKKGDEGEVLREYKSANGRSKIENLLIGQQSTRIRQEFLSFMGLLKFWRDEAAHGTRSDIGENQAFTSLALLLRFAQFAETHWNEITA